METVRRCLKIVRINPKIIPDQDSCQDFRLCSCSMYNPRGGVHPQPQRPVSPLPLKHMSRTPFHCALFTVLAVGYCVGSREYQTRAMKRVRPTDKNIEAAVFAQATSAAARRASAARPLRRLTDSLSRASEIKLFSFEFQRVYLGHEGPNHTRIEGEPSAGAQYIVRANIFRQEAIRTMKFELVDVNNRVIGLLHFFKSNNSPEDGDYVGLVDVPSHPFRVMVSGTDVNDTPYQRIFPRLFRPTRRPPATPLIPPGFPPARAKEIRQMLEAIDKQARAQFADESKRRPDGVIVIPRIEVSNFTYEPFLSPMGNLLGMRLKYDMRFSADGNYAHSFHAFPLYTDIDFRGKVEMKVFRESIEPRPERPTTDPNIWHDPNTLILHGSEAGYRADTTYHFVVDLIPDYVFQNAAKTKFCVYNLKFKESIKAQNVWRVIKASSRPVRYRVSMQKADFDGDTEDFHPLKAFTDSFLSEGAEDCKPYANSNF